MMRVWLGWAIASICLLTACAAGPSGQMRVAEAKASLDAAPACCDSLSKADNIPLPLKKTTIEIDGKSQAFEFESKKSFFKVFSLPAFTRPYGVLVTSLAGGPLADLTVFVPRVAMLNANFDRTRFFEEASLRSRGNNLERTIFINPADSQERYILIYGSGLASSVELTFSQVSSQTYSGANGGLFVFHTGNDAKAVVRAAPVGRLEIEVQGLESERL